jgi:mono/diheme cytochrome c family protein
MSNHLFRFRSAFIIGLTFVFSFTSFSGAFAQDDRIPSDDAAISNGQSLFKANCQSCHKIHEKLTGPALAGVENRAPSIDWILAFVKNSQRVIKSGDPYAVKLYNEFNQTEMNAFPTFKDEEILNILAYIRNEAEKGPATQVAADGEGTQGPAGDGGIPSSYLTAIMIGFVVVLLLILVVLALIINVLTKFINQKELDPATAEVVNSRFDIGGIVKSRPFIGLVTFVLVAVVFKALISGLFTIGVQQGYAPKQPIAFSHKIHAGQFEIDCQYCHTSVYESKQANIPSANICMNCHSAIKTESVEIQKIYAAVEKNQPIEWIRIHNLPDLSYFNHSQHTNVGGIECQTCHGPIEEMEVVRQHSLLTMGWCIDCHRKTDVNAKGNAYYDNLMELHKKNGKEAMKVEDNGGLECAKCHY